MTLISAIPKNTWDGNGLTTPDEDAMLEGVVSDLQTAFNNNLNLSVNNMGSMSTPQGQIAQSITQIKGEINDNLRFLSNQINPKYSSGIYQDALAWLYFIVRKPSTPTIVSVECYGLDGTIIPIGIKVKSSLGDSYTSISTETIGAGIAIVTFECDEKGSILAPSNTLNQIQKTVVGWDSCNNPLAGVVGANEESRGDFEDRRFDSVSKNAHGTLDSIFAAVAEVAGVVDVYSLENVTNSTIVVDGYSITAHSIYIAVIGGINEDVAKAIFLKKDVGADYNGNTTVIVKDLNYSFPQPEYEVKFERPTELPVLIKITVVNDPLMLFNSETLIKNATIEAFNGLDGGVRARIGGAIIANRFTSHIIATSPHTQVLDIDIGTVIANLNRVDVPIDKFPTINSSDITVIYV